MPEYYPQRLPAIDQLLGLAEAMVAGRRVELQYRDAGGEATLRAVDPLALACAAGPWHLAAWCHLRGAFRTFRVDRIAEVRRLRQRAAPGPFPPGFDPRGQEANSFFQPGAKAGVVRATVELTGRVLPLATAFFPRALREFPSPDRTLCHVRATDLWSLANLAASFGEGVELVHPAKGVELMVQLRSIPF